jgi:ubiquitin-conjugating enzyme E2 O
MAGNDIGSVVPEEEEESASRSAPKAKPGVIRTIPLNRRYAGSFDTSLKVLYEDLLMEFNVKGADTRKFMIEKLKKDQPAGTWEKLGQLKIVFGWRVK